MNNIQGIMLFEFTSTHNTAYQSIDSSQLGLFGKLPNEILIAIVDELEVSHYVDFEWTRQYQIPIPQWFKDEKTNEIRDCLFPKEKRLLSN